MSYAILALFLGEQFSGKEHRKNRKKGRSHYEKNHISPGCCRRNRRALYSRFASEGRPASNAPAKLETAVTTLGEGINSDTTAADETLDNKDSEHRGVTLVEDGGEYVAELGESLSTTDTAKDPVL